MFYSSLTFFLIIYVLVSVETATRRCRTLLKSIRPGWWKASIQFHGSSWVCKPLGGLQACHLVSIYYLGWCALIIFDSCSEKDGWKTRGWWWWVFVIRKCEWESPNCQSCFQVKWYHQTAIHDLQLWVVFGMVKLISSVSIGGNWPEIQDSKTQPHVNLLWARDGPKLRVPTK